jgi:hypothetical protein
MLSTDSITTVSRLGSHAKNGRLMKERGLPEDKVPRREAVCQDKPKITGVFRKIEHLIAEDRLARLHAGT